MVRLAYPIQNSMSRMGCLVSPSLRTLMPFSPEDSELQGSCRTNQQARRNHNRSVLDGSTFARRQLRSGNAAGSGRGIGTKAVMANDKPHDNYFVDCRDATTRAVERGKLWTARGGRGNRSRGRESHAWSTTVSREHVTSSGRTSAPCGATSSTPDVGHHSGWLRVTSRCSATARANRRSTTKQCGPCERVFVGRRHPTHTQNCEPCC